MVVPVVRCARLQIGQLIAQVAEDNLLKNEDIRALLDMEGEGKA